jgi:iron uptake system EfeUOB component EfeO/EfeM
VGEKECLPRVKPQIHSRLELRGLYMKRTLSLLAIGALVLIPSISRADDSVADKAEDVFRGIRQGFKDAAHDVKQAVVGHDVEVSLGERHLEMPTTVEAGEVTFTVRNEGSENRGFKISGPGLERSLTEPLPPGESETMTVNLQPGIYQVEVPAQDDPTKQLTVELTAVAE